MDLDHSSLGVHRKVQDSGKPMIFEDIQSDPRYEELSISRRAKEGGFSFNAIFPIRIREKTAGILVCVGLKPRCLMADEIQLIETMTDQLGVAIENVSPFERIRIQAAELEKSNEAKEEFLGFVSHELKTPLNLVIGYTAMIQDKAFGEIAPAQEQALGKVLQNCNDLLAMIDGLLNASKAQADTFHIETHQFNLKHLFDELRSKYDFHIGKELTLIWNCPSELPAIKSDREKLGHILQNLINNAVKFTNGGHITISARYVPDAQAMNVKVADTGIGIQKELLPSIFEMFRQVDSSETRSFGGVGVGLYIVKKYTDMLGGKIEVESEPDRGSTFTVTIPWKN